MSDGINNLSQQIRGVKTKKGTYAQVPLEDVNDFKRQQDVMTRFDQDMINKNSSIQKSSDQLYELTRRDHYDGNDPLDIEHFLKNRANGIRTTAAQKIKDMIKLKQFEHGRHALQKVVRQKIQQNKLQDELNNVIETEQKQNAASTIQNAIKSRKARSELKQNKELKTISNAVVGDMQNQIIKQQEPYNNAASTIQGAVKGYKARKAMNQEQLSLQGEKQIKQQQAKQLLSQIQPQTDLSTRLKTTRKPFIPPNIQTIESKQQREQSLRDIIRQVEDTNEPLYTLSQSSDKAATKIGKVIKGHLSRKDIRNEILKQASNEKTAATTLQSAIRKRRANQNYTMRQNQVIAEAELKQMEAAKDKAIKDDAAKKLQASIKRVKRLAAATTKKEAVAFELFCWERVGWGPDTERTGVAQARAPCRIDVKWTGTWLFSCRHNS